MLRPPVTSSWQAGSARTCGLRVLSRHAQTGVPDNTKTDATKACRYDPDLDPTYQEMAMHYRVGVVPARPYKLRDAIPLNEDARGSIDHDFGDGL